MVETPTVEQVAEILARAPKDQPWRLEGPVRHRVRSILILAGWSRSWHRADLEARRLVANGRNRNGVNMPRGWDHNDLSIWIGSAECPICDRAFIPQHPGHVCCSELCQRRRRYIREHHPTVVRCARCNVVIESPRPDQTYCGKSCRNRAHHDRQTERDGVSRYRMASAIRRAEREAAERENPRCCEGCGTPLIPGCPPYQKFCSARCCGAAWARRRRAIPNGHAKPNGHANGHDHEDDHGPAAGNGHDQAGGRERGAQDRAGAGAGAPGAPRLDAAAAAARGEAALCGSHGRGD